MHRRQALASASVLSATIAMQGAVRAASARMARQGVFMLTPTGIRRLKEASMALSGTIVAAASSAAPAVHATERAETQVTLKKAISDVLNTSATAWREGNLDRFMACYARSRDITYASGGIVTKGYDNIREMYRARFGGSTGASLGNLSIEIVDLQALGTEFVYVIGRFSLDPGAGKPLHSGLTTLLFKHTPDGWRIIADHS